MAVNRVPTPSAASNLDQASLRRFTQYVQQLNQRRNDMFRRFTGNPEAQKEVETWYQRMLEKLQQRFAPQRPSGPIGTLAQRPAVMPRAATMQAPMATPMAAATRTPTMATARRFNTFPSTRRTPTSRPIPAAPVGITPRVNRSPAMQRSLPTPRPMMARGRTQFNYAI